MDDEEIKIFTEDWASLTPPGRNYYRGMYRTLRRSGALPDQPEDRETAREHLAMILHLDRNQAFDHLKSLREA